MTPPEFEQSVIALACWRGGQRDGLIGMLSIACLIRNRVEAGIAETPYWAAISLTEMQSGFEIEDDLSFPDTRDPAFATFVQKLDSILEGNTKDITGGALYYLRSSVPEYWSTPGEKISALKDLSFYR